MIQIKGGIQSNNVAAGPAKCYCTCGPIEIPTFQIFFMAELDSACGCSCNPGGAIFANDWAMGFCV